MCLIYYLFFLLSIHKYNVEEMAAELEGNMPGVLMFLMSALNLGDKTLSGTKQNTKVIPHIQHAVLPPLPLSSKHTGLQPAWLACSLPLHLELKLLKTFFISGSSSSGRHALLSPGRSSG